MCIRDSLRDGGTGQATEGHTCDTDACGDDAEGCDHVHALDVDDEHGGADHRRDDDEGGGEDECEVDVYKRQGFGRTMVSPAATMNVGRGVNTTIPRPGRPRVVVQVPMTVPVP